MHNNPKQFYVYIYMRHDGTPYYIGKGSGRRAWSYNRKGCPRPSDDRIYIFLDGLEEQHAYDLEECLVAQYGRKDINTGILRNMTSGGGGAKHLSENSKERLSHKGVDNPMFGKSHSEKTKRQISESNSGRIHTEDSKSKISAKLKGRASPRKGAKLSQDTRDILSTSNRGEGNPMFGKQHSIESKDKIRQRIQKPVVAAGNMYNSVKLAAEFLEVDPGTIRYRANKEKFTDYYYVR